MAEKRGWDRLAGRRWRHTIWSDLALHLEGSPGELACHSFLYNVRLWESLLPRAGMKGKTSSCSKRHSWILIRLTVSGWEAYDKYDNDDHRAVGLCFIRELREEPSQGGSKIQEARPIEEVNSVVVRLWSVG